MIRLTASLILVLFGSCSRHEKVETYHPKAIELNNKAVELMLRWENDSALILLDKAIGIDESYYLPHSNKIGILIRKKEFGQALQESEMVIKKNPDSPEGWTIAGMLHENQGDTVTAMNYYRKSIEIWDERLMHPEKKEQVSSDRLNRAISLLLLGQGMEGKDELRKLKAVDPDNFVYDMFLKISKEDFMDHMFGDSIF